MAEECPGCGRKIAVSFTSEGSNGVERVRIKCPVCGYNKVVTNTPDVPCFVATVVFEDAYHPSVCRLRRFRDEFLRARLWGRAFIAIYYQCGPTLARLVASRPALKQLIRTWLVRIIARLP